MADIELYEGERLDEVNERLRLISKNDGLTFGTDAFLLASFIRRQGNAKACELGAGTGIISLLLAARERVSEIVAIEAQGDFAELAQRNVSLNGLSDRIKILNGDVRDITSADMGGEMDIVFTNPPYMRTDSGKRNDSDRKYIARHEVLGGISDFCASAGRLLKHGGKFYCVWRPDRLSELMGAMRDNRLEPKTMVFVHADEESEPSMVLVSATKGGAPSMRIMPPLLLHLADSKNDKSRKMTERAEKIYETMSFYD
ncbi:MAG: methyltransferase domain-containing protein [Ruminococcaceae bacterium]|nr:methyltransferase domain-containing protein [Oscillospiraceae bacterium]